MIYRYDCGFNTTWSPAGLSIQSIHTASSWHYVWALSPCRSSRGYLFMLSIYSRVKDSHSEQDSQSRTASQSSTARAGQPVRADVNSFINLLPSTFSPPRST